MNFGWRNNNSEGLIYPELAPLMRKWTEWEYWIWTWTHKLHFPNETITVKSDCGIYEVTKTTLLRKCVCSRHCSENQPHFHITKQLAILIISVYDINKSSAIFYWFQCLPWSIDMLVCSITNTISNVEQLSTVFEFWCLIITWIVGKSRPVTFIDDHDNFQWCYRHSLVKKRIFSSAHHLLLLVNRFIQSTLHPARRKKKRSTKNEIA